MSSSRSKPVYAQTAPGIEGTITVAKHGSGRRDRYVVERRINGAFEFLQSFRNQDMALDWAGAYVAAAPDLRVLRGEMRELEPGATIVYHRGRLAAARNARTAGGAIVAAYADAARDEYDAGRGALYTRRRDGGFDYLFVRSK